MKRGPLEQLTDVILAGKEYPNVHGLLLVKDDHLVYERYFTGEDRRYGPDGQRHIVEMEFDRDTLHDLRSVTKSVTSALVGAALATDLVPSLETPLCDVYPSRSDVCNARKRDITLRHALTMSAGLEWNEADVPYTDPSNDEEQLYYQAKDPVGYILGKPLAANPGAEWYYNSGLPILLGFSLSRTAEISLDEFAQQRLFEPLGIRSWEWRGPPTFAGEPTPAGNLWLRPRDLAKIGALYLHDGEWNGRQVLPRGWVQESTRPHVPRRPPTVEYGDLAVGEHAYGYLWWHDRYRFSDELKLEVWSARGNGGQRIWIVPEFDLLGVHVTGRYNQLGASRQADRLLLEHLIPWARGEAQPRPRLPEGRPVLAIASGGWNEIHLDPTQRALYVGTYDEHGEKVEVWEEDGLLKITPPPGKDQREIHLIPEGDHVFAQGLYEDGRPVKIFWPQARLVFVISNGSVKKYEARSARGDIVYGIGLRVP